MKELSTSPIGHIYFPALPLLCNMLSSLFIKGQQISEAYESNRVKSSIPHSKISNSLSSEKKINGAEDFSVKNKGLPLMEAIAQGR